MASGRRHEAINLGVLFTLGGLYFLGQRLGWSFIRAIQSQPALAFALSFLVGTFFVTPDLDLAENKVRAKKHWGLLGVLWVPYGYLFSHRGMSHSWVLGPLSRLIYLAILIALVGGAAFLVSKGLGYSINISARMGDRWPKILIGALLGFYISQWLHLLADGVGPLHGLRRRGK